MDNFETILRDMMKNKSNEQIVKEFTDTLNKMSEEQKKQEKEEREKLQKKSKNITQMYNSLRQPDQKYTFKDAATTATLAFINENPNCTAEEIKDFRDGFYHNTLTFYDLWKDDWKSALTRIGYDIKEKIPQPLKIHRVKDDDTAIADFLDELFS